MIKEIFLINNKKITFPKFLVNFVFLLFIIVFLLHLALKKIGINMDFASIYHFKIRIFDGFLMTLYISLGTFIFSSLFAIVIVSFQKSNIIILKYVASTYVLFIRGTPLIMQIYLFFYIIGAALNIKSRFQAGVVILSIFEASYISEILRSGLDSIDKSQLEIAKSIGYTKLQTFRFIIFPQLMAKITPALAGQFSSIVKDSSLLSIISVVELTQTFREISATNFKLFECYIILGVLYLIFTSPLMYVSKYLERKFKYEA